MNAQTQSKARTIRNLAIFTLVVLAIGWLGRGLDRLMNNPPAQSLGLLLWLVVPLITALLLRLFAGDGWKDFGVKPAFKGNGLWYAVSLLAYPGGAAIVLAIGRILSLVSFPAFSPGSLISAFALGLLPAFFKNIFEEFAWRGYLAPKVYSLGLNDYAGHIIVGLVWGCWHIPYYLFFLGRSDLQAYTSQGWATFFPTMLLGIIVASFVYGEIRLATNSVWPAVLMHMVGNAFVNPLLLEGLIKIAPGMDFLVSPGPESLLSIAIFALVGVGLRQLRRKRQLAA